MGLAYNATFYSQKIFDDSARWIGPDNFSEIPRDGYQGGAVITQNSWGESPGDGAYCVIDEAYDRAARDADPALDGNQELTQVFAAGNDGPLQNTIGSPASGKNVICIGSVPNYMPDSDVYGDEWGVGTGPDSISFFSSRGWTDDNRIKPDVVAPGEAVLSTRSPVGGTGHGLYSEDSRYMWASGTSMATPTATGAVAVLYEWFLTTYGVEPSPAVLKALLVNNAVDIGTPDIPNKNEGWGLVNISTVIDPLATWQIHDQEHELTTGVIDEFKVTYDVPTEPLKITLVYTDRYALDGDLVTLKNQVNLEVLCPSGDVYHGNAFSNGWTTANTNPNFEFDTDQDGYDDRNNVEAVYIPSADLQPGVYTVRIIGSNIVADADNDGANDQDYALVMFNAIESVPWPYEWFSIGMDSLGDGALGDTTLNITEVKTAYDSNYLFIRLVLEGPSPKLTDNSWWVYLDLTADGENDWLVEERPDISGGVFSYEWSTINSNWTPKMISTVSDMDSDSAIRNITVSGSGCIDFALKLNNYPGFNLNAFNITAASDTLEDLNLSDDTNRNPTDTSDPSCSDVAEFDDSVGPISFVNVPPTITTVDNMTAYEDSLYFVNYDASDPQGGLLRWSINTNASFLSIMKLTGFLKGIPTNADIGEFWVNVTITDPGGLLDFHNFTLLVINVGPLILTEDLKYAVSEVYYCVDYNSSDDGQGSVSWSLDTNATWLSINSSNGILNGTPTNSDIGYYWVNVTVSDGCGDSDFHNFTLAVLLPHLPIKINNNTDFANQAAIESWPGSGTPLDPYIIEGYSINATKAEDAISISNTNVSFEVRGNYLYNASTGVDLDNVTNGVIRDNIILNNDDGILIWHSSNGNNTILRNKISHDSWDGICIFYSSNNLISYNTISDMEGDGIYLKDSDWNIIDNNTISEIFWYDGISIDSSNNNSINDNTIFGTGYYGVVLDDSKNNIFSNNTVSRTNEISMFLDHSQNNIITDNNILGGIYIYEANSESIINNTITQGIYLWNTNLEQWDTHTIISNTVGEKPIYFWKNRNGGTISSDAGQVILFNCTNIIIENLKIDSIFVGIKLAMSSHITIANTTISNTLNFWEVGEGILSYDSDNITIINNTVTRCFSESISIDGINNSIISNTVSDAIMGEGIFFSSSNGKISNNNIHSNKEGYGLYLYYGGDNTVTNNSITNNKDGICIRNSNSNLIDNNFILNNYGDYGIRLLDANWNTISHNTISNNRYGVYVQDTNKNYIYHNNFIDNIDNGYDSGVNSWNLPYPLGGNYWSDYTGVDLFKGPNQDQPGSDGIGDTNYSFDSDSVDHYPLMEPYTYKPFENYTILKQGWNLISIPLSQKDQGLKKVLEMIDGHYDAVQWYDSSDSQDPWKHHKVGKSFGIDLFELNETMGFWVHITHAGDTIFAYNGSLPTVNRTITLYPGWNLVGYPSLMNRTRDNALNNIDFGGDVDAIWTYNAYKQKWEEIGPSAYFELGRGYWIHSMVTKTWNVPL
jgi:parallel beta-helix repeat protein